MKISPKTLEVLKTIGYVREEREGLDVLEEFCDAYCWEWNSQLEYDDNGEPIYRTWEARRLGSYDDWITFRADGIDTLLVAMANYERISSQWNSSSSLLYERL